MRQNPYEVKVVKRCPNCDWRILDKVTPTSGVIELKCPNCRKVVEIDLSYRTTSPSTTNHNNSRPRIIPQYRVACRA